MAGTSTSVYELDSMIRGYRICKCMADKTRKCIMWEDNKHGE